MSDEAPQPALGPPRWLAAVSITLGVALFVLLLRHLVGVESVMAWSGGKLMIVTDRDTG